MTSPKLRVEYDQIPDLIEEEFLPMMKAQLERLRALEAPTPKEVSQAMRIADSLSEMFLQYRALRSIMKRELQAGPRERLNGTVVHKPAIALPSPQDADPKK